MYKYVVVQVLTCRWVTNVVAYSLSRKIHHHYCLLFVLLCTGTYSTTVGTVPAGTKFYRTHLRTTVLWSRANLAQRLVLTLLSSFILPEYIAVDLLREKGVNKKDYKVL